MLGMGLLIGLKIRCKERQKKYIKIRFRIRFANAQTGNPENLLIQ